MNKNKLNLYVNKNNLSNYQMDDFFRDIDNFVINFFTHYQDFEDYSKIQNLQELQNLLDFLLYSFDDFDITDDIIFKFIEEFFNQIEKFNISTLNSIFHNFLKNLILIHELKCFNSNLLTNSNHFFKFFDEYFEYTNSNYFKEVYKNVNRKQFYGFEIENLVKNLQKFQEEL